MQKKDWAILWLIIFLIYEVLATFFLLLGNAYFWHMESVVLIGKLVDLPIIQNLWMPGWILGFILGATMGHTAMFIGQIITYLLGSFIILKLTGVSLKELT